LKDQVGGKITITETDAERLEKNKEIRINCTEAANKYGFDIEDAKVEVTEGDLEIKHEFDKKTGEIVIKVTRTSDEASTITVSEVEITTDRTVPEGTFDFQVGGTAISKLNNKEYTNDKNKEETTSQYEDAIELVDFVKVGTKNTEDLPNAAAAKEIVLTVGAKEYTVNKEAKVADAAAYIDANNRTMVPVKFIAEEFGKLDFGTVNGVGTVTVFKDGSVLQFQNGSNIMNKNGIAIPMDTAVVIKDGRTYVPFKYVADGLGIGFSFDPATKSITFTNQVK
ncbi:MAG: stalk domain-containing protein, partial [Niameybacter sp.]